MKKKWQVLLSTIVAVLGIGVFSSANQVDAKIKFTTDTTFYKSEPDNAKPSVLSMITTINQNGTLIYDADTVQQKNVITAAADHWNKAVGINLIMSYQQANVPKADADVVIKPADLPDGVGGVTGYNGVVYEGWQNIIEIGNSTLNAATSHNGFVQAVSTTSHEMGHALGLNHDPGALMGTSGADDLAKGILPNIPAYNVNAIGDMLKALNQLYPNAKPINIPNMSDFRDDGTTEKILPTDPIASETFGSEHLVSRNFNGGKIEIKINENVYQVGRGEVGTTNSLNLTNTQQQIVTGYVSASGNRYYQIKVGDQYYIIWGDQDIITGDAYQDTSKAANISDTDLISNLSADTPKLVTRDFTPTKIEITGNENVYQVGIGYVGTTASLNLTGKQMQVLTTYTDVNGNHAYQIYAGGRYLVLWDYLTKVVN